MRSKYRLRALYFADDGSDPFHQKLRKEVRLSRFLDANTSNFDGDDSDDSGISETADEQGLLVEHLSNASSHLPGMIRRDLESNSEDAKTSCVMTAFFTKATRSIHVMADVRCPFRARLAAAVVDDPRKPGGVLTNHCLLARLFPCSCSSREIVRP